ncbi:MAG: class A beta-lactamase-related serine hydrolase [Gammaproteobacteria bacterium]|nr:class A beta-lactamase-related serine hydrolase [Gammaproteobacteria bacterium]
MQAFFKKTSLGLALFCALQAYAAALPVTGNSLPQYAGLDQKMSALMQKWHIPGGSLAIYKHGNVVFARGYGYADLDAKTLVQPNSLFRLASTSKTLTAVGIFSLIESGKLSLGDSAYGVFPVTLLPGARGNNDIGRLTIANLLEMSAGWSALYDPMFGPWPKSEVDYFNLSTPPSCLTVARYMAGKPFQFKPGSSFAYANVDYCILGLIIAKVGGGAATPEAYETYMKQHLFAPLGITDMFIGSSDPSKRRAGEVHYYAFHAASSERTDGYIEADDLPYSTDDILRKNFANGGWVASAPDLAKFMGAVFAGDVIPMSDVELMKNSPVHPNPKLVKGAKGVRYLPWPYGMGLWRVQMGSNILYVAHGSYNGTNTLILKKPNGEVDVALFNAKPGRNMSDLWIFREQLIKILMGASK